MTQNVMTKKEETKTEATAPESIHGGVCYTPRVDILETETELVLYADLPGCKPEDVDVRYENGQLEIHGKCQPRRENADYLLNEYGVGDYYRAFTISDEFDASKINATIKQGVLTVRLPKSAEAMPRRIPVKGE